MYEFEGTPVWHALNEKYGDKFEEMERQRKRRHDLKIMEPYMRMRMTIEEYYSLLESGKLKDDYNHSEI
jgi:hypothetical protein